MKKGNLIHMLEDRQTWSFRGSKSRNKVSVGEPAEGSLPNFKNVKALHIEDACFYKSTGTVAYVICAASCS